MSSWARVESEAPELAARVRMILEARRHETLATLRRDGSPRVSGIEVEVEDGQLAMGVMPGSVKLQDIRRDPRVAVHAMSDDPPRDRPDAWAGDAKIGGVADPVPGPDPGDAPASHVRIDVAEVVLTRVGTPADHLVIDSWHSGRGLTRRHRR